MLHAVLQLNTWRDPWAGLFHAMLFWGIVTLTIATTVVLIHHDFHLRIMQGRFYLYFQSLFVDVLGALALVGALMAAGRRWITRPGQLVYTDEASWILVLLIAILATGFLVEGWRMAVTDDPWAAWSPCGLLVARASTVVANADTLRLWHAVTWWLHLVLVFGLIAWAPYTKLMHVLTAPLNIYTSNLDSPTGTLRAIDFESATSLGVNSLEQFTWKDLLDLDSCTECGRCTAACPAHRVGKQLSPRDLILDLGRLQRASDLPSLVQATSGGDDEYQRGRSADRHLARAVARSAVAMYDLCRVRRRLSGRYRATDQDRRYATLPGDGRGRIPTVVAGRTRLAGRTWPSVSRSRLFEVGLGRRAERAGRGGRGSIRCAAVGRLRWSAGRAKPDGSRGPWPNC